MVGISVIDLVFLIGVAMDAVERTAGHLWGIVLAAGEGTRVRAFLARLGHGRGIKQFCAVIGRRSMLEHTLARVERLIPRERILIVVSPSYREEIGQQLGHWPPENVIFQPANRETAPGILLPLVHLWHRDPCAMVAIFPSDHFIVDEARFMAYVHRAVVETERFPQEMTLLGMPPDRAEEGYGWIEGAEQPGRETRAVERFWEKPPLAQSLQLLERGALWNTFVCVTRATILWDVVRWAAPDLYAAFVTIARSLGSRQAAQMTVSVYQTMRSVNFSSEVCERCPSWLRVLPVPDVGWSDWGSAERILASLQRIGKLDECLARLRKREVALALPFEESSLSRHLIPPAAPPRIATWEHSPVTGGTKHSSERRPQLL
jgi:mannose-1-phosphate guanylyltransferase